MNSRGVNLAVDDVPMVGVSEPLAGKKTIIVDDDAFIREALRLILREQKLEVISEHSSGEKLLDALRYQQPDYIFLDIKMSGMSGLEVLEKLRKEYSTSKVVVISSGATKEVVQSAMGLGAAGFVVKPFKPAAVVRTLERINSAAHTNPHQ